MKSMLSVVADSSIVDVWVIDKMDLNYLNDKADLKKVYEAVMDNVDADRPMHEQDMSFLVDQFEKWD